MTQGELGHRVDIVFANHRGTAPGRVGPRGTQPDQVGAHTIDAGGETACGNLPQGMVIQGNRRQVVTRTLATLAQFLLGTGPLCAKSLGVAVEVQATADDLAPGRRLGLAAQDDVEAKAVEQLRTQFALFRVHGTDQDETSAVTMGNTVAFDAVGTTGRHIEQQVDHMIGQQIDFIDIQHAPVGCGEHPRGKLRAPLAQRRIQVQRAHQPFFGCT
ncbi:hypothetical protein D3C84_531340 [compost metagenome]